MQTILLFAIAFVGSVMAIRVSHHGKQGESPLGAAPARVGKDTLTQDSVGIVDDLLPYFLVSELSPTAELVIRWKETILGIGTAGDRLHFDYKVAQSPPTVDFNPDADTKYNLLIVNIDAPNGRGADNNAEYLHWLVSDIKNPTTIESLEQIPYEAPTPPPESNVHRYVILLLKNSEKTPEGANLKDVPPTVPQADGSIQIDRTHFETVRFIKDNEFKLVAIDFFFARP